MDREIKLSWLVRSTYFILFLCFLTDFVLAQVKSDTLFGDQYFRKADSLAKVENHSIAVEFYNKALLSFQETQVWEKQAICYNRIAESEIYLSNFSQAMESAKGALSICETKLKRNHHEAGYAYYNIANVHLAKEELTFALQYAEKALKIGSTIATNENSFISKLFNTLGNIYRRKTNYDQALSNFHQAIAIRRSYSGKKHKDIATSYNGIGGIYYEKGDYNFALDYFNKSLKISKNISLGRNERVAICHNNIGALHYENGDYAKSLEYYTKSLNIYKEVFGVKYSGLANIYNNIGEVYYTLDAFDYSYEFLQKALNIQLEIFGEKHPDIARSYYNLARIFHWKENYSKALNYHQKSIAISFEILGNRHPDIALSYFEIGNIYYKKNDFKRALEYHTKALMIRKEVFGDKHAHVALSLMCIGHVYHQMGDFERAMVHYQKSLEANTINSYDREWNDLPKLEDFLDINQLLESLNKKAEILKSLYHKYHKINNLEESFKIYQLCDTLISKVRESHRTHKDKVEFGKSAVQVYEGAIQTCILLNDSTKDPKYLQSAFYFSEKSKSSALKESRSELSAKHFNHVPDDLIELERSLKIDRAFYQSSIHESVTQKDGYDTTKVNDFNDRLFAINRRYDSLTDVIEKQFPKYHQLKYEKKIISVEELKQALSSNQAVVEYFLGDSISYAFVVTNDTLVVEPLKSLENINEQVEAFRNAIQSKNINEYKRLGHSLYQSIFNPIVEKVQGKELIIIPHGALWHVNFDLLLSEQTESEDYRNLPYLVKDFSISYGNAAHLLFDNTINRKVDQLNQCLAFSYTDTTAVNYGDHLSFNTLRQSNDDLPGSRAEIRSIAAIVDGQYYYGKDANERNFKRQADQYAVLHLALHGEINDENPEHSRLYFTQTKDSVEDNHLYVHELYALNLPSELAVLSACDAGTGKLEKGEGIMSLGRAFQYAGAKSLLLSSWEVSDGVAPDIMKYFYGNLKEGMNKSEALRQAKLEYLKKADVLSANPFYWGNFFIVGDNSPIELDGRSYLQYAIYAVLGMVLLLLILLFIKRKKELDVSKTIDKTSI
ncbi:CHAT domain-containing protein [Fulvivirgaceae bacterium BMA10]|uniref:CHAT domain-containing protein n=1 Tax=Splendidivirga corallicola TaxID=3051826 RepID=A0ABT8KXT7_9BACT|nr:CHAT domain-containing protein [Fulvivirgaceae bacterium BMA10]